MTRRGCLQVMKLQLKLYVQRQMANAMEAAESRGAQTILFVLKQLVVKVTYIHIHTQCVYIFICLIQYTHIVCIFSFLCVRMCDRPLWFLVLSKYIRIYMFHVA